MTFGNEDGSEEVLPNTANGARGGWMTFSGGSALRTYVKLTGRPGTFMHFCGFKLFSNTG